MNANKFTQKSLEAIQSAQNIAVENGNAQIEQEHIILALLEQEDSLIKELLMKMNVQNGFESEVRQKVNNKPKMQGGARRADSIYIAQDVDIVITNAESIASKMKDEYVKTEIEKIKSSWTADQAYAEKVEFSGDFWKSFDLRNLVEFMMN